MVFAGILLQRGDIGEVVELRLCCIAVTLYLTSISQDTTPSSHFIRMLNKLRRKLVSKTCKSLKISIFTLSNRLTED